LRIPPLDPAGKRGYGKAESCIERRFVVRGSPRHGAVIRLRGNDSDARAQIYRLGERVLGPKQGFCPLFYVSVLGISAEAGRHPVICSSRRPAE
jgi:hypothetical protein